MKKKTNIRTVIRKIVREEVATAINEVITELKQPTQQTSQPKPRPKKKIAEKKIFTKNSVLNEVMNETAQDEEWPTMGGEAYDSSKARDLLNSNYDDMMNDNSGKSNGNLAASMGVNPNDAPDFLTKDYRGLMKAIDKKKGSR